MVRLVQRYQPKISAITKKLEAVYTKEQQDLIQRSRQMAIRAGVNPKNIGKRVQETIDTIELTGEQQSTLAGAKKEQAALKKEIRRSAASFLTQAQANQLFGGPNQKRKKKD